MCTCIRFIKIKELKLSLWVKSQLNFTTVNVIIFARAFKNQISKYLSNFMGCPRGVMVKAMNSGIVVREFVLQSRYYVHFRANTLGKGMNPLILPPAMGK